MKTSTEYIRYSFIIQHGNEWKTITE